jgi:hypothetical protein
MHNKTKTPTTPIQRVCLKKRKSIVATTKAKVTVSMRVAPQIVERTVKGRGSVLGRYQPAASGRDGKPVAGLEVTNALPGWTPETK